MSSARLGIYIYIYIIVESLSGYVFKSTYLYGIAACSPKGDPQMEYFGLHMLALSLDSLSPDRLNSSSTIYCFLFQTNKLCLSGQKQTLPLPMPKCSLLSPCTLR